MAPLRSEVRLNAGVLRESVGDGHGPRLVRGAERASENRNDTTVTREAEGRCRSETRP